jgi:hypothetical protein
MGSVFNVSGCTDILPFDEFIIVLANNRLIKIDLIESKT